DLQRHARDLGRELAHLLDHAVDDVGRAQELALQRAAIGLQRDGAGQVALGHAGDRFGDGFDRAHQVVDQLVDRLLHLRPAALAGRGQHALAGLALAAYLLPDTRQFTGQAPVGVDDLVEARGELALDAIPVRGQPYREIAGIDAVPGVGQLHEGVRGRG